MVCYMLHHPSTPISCLPEYMTDGQLENDNIIALITELRAIAASENLWFVDFSHGSTNNDILFMKWSAIWSGSNSLCVRVCVFYSEN